MRRRNSGSERNEECVMFFSVGNVNVEMIVSFYMMSRFIIFNNLMYIFVIIIYVFREV